MKPRCDGEGGGAGAGMFFISSDIDAVSITQLCLFCATLVSVSLIVSFGISSRSNISLRLLQGVVVLHRIRGTISALLGQNNPLSALTENFPLLHFSPPLGLSLDADIDPKLLLLRVILPASVWTLYQKRDIFSHLAQRSGAPASTVFSSKSPITTALMAKYNMRTTVEDAPEASPDLSTLRETLAANLKPFNWPAPPDRIKIIRKTTASTKICSPRVVLEYLNPRKPPLPTLETAKSSFRTIEDSLGCAVDEVLIRAGPDHGRLRTVMRIRGPSDWNSHSTLETATRLSVSQGSDARHVGAAQRVHHVACIEGDPVGGATQPHGPQIGSQPGQGDCLVADNTESSLKKVSRHTSSPILSPNSSINRTVSIRGPQEGLLGTADKGRLDDNMVLGMLEFGYPFKAAGKRSSESKKKATTSTSSPASTTESASSAHAKFSYPKLPANARFIVAIDGDIDQEHDGTELPSNARLILAIDEKDLDLLGAEAKTATSERVPQETVDTGSNGDAGAVDTAEAVEEATEEQELEAVHDERVEPKTPLTRRRENPFGNIVRLRMKAFRSLYPRDSKFLFCTAPCAESKHHIAEPSEGPPRKRARPDDGDDDLYIRPEILKPIGSNPVGSEISAELQPEVNNDEDIPENDEIVEESSRSKDEEANENNESNTDVISTLPGEADGVSTLPGEADGVSTLPREEDAVSALPREEDAVSALPREADGVSTLAREEDGVSAPPGEADAVSTLPREEDAVLALPREEDAVSTLAREGDAVSALPREGDAVCTDIIVSPRHQIPRPFTPPLDESPAHISPSHTPPSHTPPSHTPPSHASSSRELPKMGPLVVLPPQSINEISPPPSEPASPAIESDTELVRVTRDSKPMSISTTWCTENDVFTDSKSYIERPITPASSIRSTDSRRWSTFSRFSTNTGLTTPPPTRPGSAVNTPGSAPMKLLTWTDEVSELETIPDGINSSRPQPTYQTPTKVRRPLLSEMSFENVQKVERPQLRRWSSHLVKIHTRFQSPILLSPAEELVASIEEGYMFPSPEREAEPSSAIARRLGRRRSRKPTVVELNTAEEFQEVRELFDELSDVEEEIHRLSEGEDSDEDEDDAVQSRIVELKDNEEIAVGVKGVTERKREKLLRKLKERARKLKTKVVTVVRGGKRLSSVPKESTPAVVVA